MSEAEVVAFPAIGSFGTVLLSDEDVEQLGMPLPPSTTGAEVLSVGALLGPLLDLDPNWDGYGALPPTASALSLAASFLSTAHDLLPAPEVMASVGGGVLLEWESDDADLTLEVGPSGDVDACVRRGDVEDAGTLAELESAVGEVIGILASLR